MASAIPSPSALRSWDEAFQHPLPIVRKLEHQFRQTILSNQETLRSLVGGSYRDLLGTAEKIIVMNTEIQTVDRNLGSIGRKCDSRVLERGMTHVGLLEKGKDESKLGRVARLRVVQGALEAVGRGVRRGEDALVGAKLLVLARLILKGLSGEGNTDALLQELGRKTASLRKRLLRYIDATLVKTRGEGSSLVNPLCAYAMISSSAPREVLKHFLQVRFGSLEGKAQTPSHEAVLQILDLYSNTVVDTRATFPRRLAEGIAQVAKTPLLHDPQVSSVPELNLDVYAQWVPEDIRTFTPWVRHEQLSGSDVAEGLKSWSQQVQILMLQSVEASLEELNDVKEVLAFRHTVLSKYFSVSARTRAEDVTGTIDGLQEAFLNHLRCLASQAAEVSLDLSSFTSPTASEAGNHRSVIWHLAKRPLDASQGALALRSAALDHMHGRDEQVSQVHESLSLWVARLNTFWASIASMGTTKWDQDLEMDIDDIDYDSPIGLRQLLNRCDPAEIQKRCWEVASDSIRAACLQVKYASEDPAPAMHLIRILRELMQSQRGLVSGLALGRAVNESVLASLYDSIAAQACEQPLGSLNTALERQTRPVTLLWDGTPPLPVQPSPTAFSFLTALQRSMADMGGDLWSTKAVAAVRHRLVTALAESYNRDLVSLASGQQVEQDQNDGEAVIERPHESTTTGSADASEELRTEQAATQQLFDLLYLSQALARTESIGSVLQPVKGKVLQRAGIDEVSQQRLQKSAKEYWKRTYLLFGLLAPQAI